MSQSESFGDDHLASDSSLSDIVNRFKPRLPPIKCLFMDQEWTSVVSQPCVLLNQDLRPLVTKSNTSLSTYDSKAWKQNVGWYRYQPGDGEHGVQDIVDFLYTGLEKYLEPRDPSAFNMDEIEDLYFEASRRPVYPPEMPPPRKKLAPDVIGHKKDDVVTSNGVQKANRLAKPNTLDDDNDEAKKLQRIEHTTNEKERRTDHRWCQFRQGEMCGDHICREADIYIDHERERKSLKPNTKAPTSNKTRSRKLRKTRRKLKVRPPGKNEIHARCILSIVFGGMVILQGREARKRLEEEVKELKTSNNDMEAKLHVSTAAYYDLKAEHDELRTRYVHLMNCEHDSEQQSYHRSAKRPKLENALTSSPFPITRYVAGRGSLPSPVLSSVNGSHCGGSFQDQTSKVRDVSVPFSDAGST